jgi:hypothetical protein
VKITETTRPEERTFTIECNEFTLQNLQDACQHFDGSNTQPMRAIAELIRRALEHQQ